MIKSGPVPLAGDSEEKEEYTGRHPPWGVSSESHELGTWSWRPIQGDESPWLDGGQQGLTGRLREAWTPFMRSTGMLAHLGGWTEVRSSCCRASCDTLGTCPCLNQVNAPGLLTPNHSMAMNLWGPQPGRRLDLGTRGYPLPGQSLGGVTVVIIGTYSSSSLKQPEPLTAAAPPQHTPRDTLRIPTSPACPAVWLHNRVRVAEAGGSGPL